MWPAGVPSYRIIILTKKIDKWQFKLRESIEISYTPLFGSDFQLFQY